MSVSTTSPPTPLGGPQLALPSGGDTSTRNRGTVSAAAIAAGVGLGMLVAGLVAAYLAMRSGRAEWPAENMKFDNYTATMLVVTLLMSSVTLEWASHGIRNDLRGQSLAAFGITVGLIAAFLNGLWYLVDKLEFGAGAHPYGTVVHTMLFVSGAAVVIGLGYIVLTFLRTAGHQLTMANFALMRSTAWFWHFVVAAWVAVYYAVYITK